MKIKDDKNYELFLVLLKNNKFKNISVTKTSKTFKISRQSFYNRYKNLDNLTYEVLIYYLYNKMDFIKINEKCYLDKLEAILTKFYNKTISKPIIYYIISKNINDPQFEKAFNKVLKNLILNKEILNNKEKYYLSLINTLMYKFIIEIAANKNFIEKTEIYETSLNLIGVTKKLLYKKAPIEGAF